MVKEHPSIFYKRFKEKSEHTVILKDEMILSKTELETQIDKQRIKDILVKLYPKKITQEINNMSIDDLKKTLAYAVALDDLKKELGLDK